MPSIEAEVMVSAEIEFEVYCAKCGDGLCRNVNTRESRNRRIPQIVIEPCQTCLENEFEKGKDSVRSECEERDS